MKEVDTTTFARAWEAGAVVLDVRESFEFAEAHAPGATWIPLGELSGRVAEVPPGETVYVICASGNRSKRGADILESAGRIAVSVAGGTLAWIAAGQPIERGLAA